MKDLYAILELEPTATLPEIRAAYRRLTLTRHPDFPTGSDEAFRELHRAFEVLSDPALRRSYDAARTSAGSEHLQRLREFAAQIATMVWGELCSELPELAQVLGAGGRGDWIGVAEGALGLFKRLRKN